MADEENKTDTGAESGTDTEEETRTSTTATTGEPKPVEMSASVTKKAAPKKAAAKKKAAVKKKAATKKKAAAKKKTAAKKAPAKKAAVKKEAPAAAASTTAAASTASTPSTATATPATAKPAAAARPHYTPPVKSMWWKALVMIVIVLFGYSHIRDAVQQPASTTAPVDSPEMPVSHEADIESMAEQMTGGAEGAAAPMQSMPYPPATTSTAEPGSMEAPVPGMAPDVSQMPSQPYAMPPSYQQGYGSYGPGSNYGYGGSGGGYGYGSGGYGSGGYGPGDYYGPGSWYGPGYPRSYPPQSQPSN